MATRREFAALNLGALLSGAVPGVLWAATQTNENLPPWYRSIKRIGQTNFNEEDPREGDVGAWIDYWVSAKVQAVALSVSGPFAFYPTEVPFFQVSRHLNGRDLFGECVRAAKTRGIRVFGRLSPDIQFISPSLLDAHPDWFRRDRKGALISTAPDVAFTCQFSGHFSEQQPAVLKELIGRYPIDGVYMNGWPSLQECYCDRCRTIGDPKSAAYRAALMDRAASLVDLYRSIVVHNDPNRFYSCNNVGGMLESGIDQRRITRAANWYTADNQARSSMEEPVWQAVQQIKYARSLMGDRPIAAVTGGYARSGRGIWRQAADTTAEATCRMAQTVAGGGIVWYHHLGLVQGFKRDRRWQKAGRNFLSWLADNDQHFQNLRSLAEVAIILPTNTMANEHAPDGEMVDHLQGVYAALTDARVMCDFVHEDDMSAEILSRYRLIILPNMARMSDLQAQQIGDFSRSGGSVLATFQTGVLDAAGKPRADFALGSLFDIEKAGEPADGKDMVVGVFTTNTLQSIRERSRVGQGYEDTDWIAAPIRVQPIKPVPDAPFTLIQPYPVYPPETVYPRGPASHQPTVVLREKGKSRLAYFAGDVDATYWRYDNADLGQQLVNSIRWLLSGTERLTVEGDGLMEVNGWRTQAGYALHFLNFNGPNAFRGHMRKAVPLGPQTVRFSLPEAASIRQVRLLSAGVSPTFRQTGRIIEVTLPSVDLYEVLAIEV